MEGFKAKIEARLNGDGNSGKPFFGGHFTLRRATLEQETEFCNFYKIVLNYIERWFQLQLLPKGISIINLENKELIYAEVVQLAEQICPENSENDELFDEVSQLNKTLNGINEEDFYLKTTEQKWKMIFDVSGATKKYKNLYRIVSAAISNASSQWQVFNGRKKETCLRLKLSGLYFLCQQILTCHALKCTKC
uniref:Uncharacterized protein n=1 Tax=Meloidogyne incognita TaxID=6306 RepID=A0A914NQP5_MELIC